MDISMTDEQIKAAKSVYRAIRMANKLGVSFWDNYGTLSAFNSIKITPPVPTGNLHEDKMISVEDDDSPIYYELLPRGAFYAGNADDKLFYKIK